MAKLEEKTLRELLDLETAAELVCRKYENEIRINRFENIELETEFQRYNIVF